MEDSEDDLLNEDFEDESEEEEDVLEKMEENSEKKQEASSGDYDVEDNAQLQEKAEGRNFTRGEYKKKNIITCLPEVIKPDRGTSRTFNT